MSKHFAKQKKTLQESILLFLCLYRLIRRRGIKYKILTSYQNKICAICLAKCSILSYHSRYLMSISLQALNSSSCVVFYSYSCEYIHKLLSFGFGGFSTYNTKSVAAGPAFFCNMGVPFPVWIFRHVSSSM